MYRMIRKIGYSTSSSFVHAIPFAKARVSASVFAVRQAGMYEESRYGRVMRIPKGSSAVDKLCLIDGESQFPLSCLGPFSGQL